MKLKKWCEHTEIVRLKTPQGYIEWYAQKIGISGGKIAGRPVVMCADLTHHNFCPVCGAKKPV